MAEAIQKKSSVNMYFCGGAGINIGASIPVPTGKKASGFSENASYFIDTSLSNLRDKKIPEEQIYLLEGVDGSGKLRKTNYELIAERAKEILLQFKPADFNIVVHSASGGSGAIISSILVSEMMSRDIPVIVIMIGSSDSRIEAENSVKALKSYEVISQKYAKPVIAVYHENTEEQNRGKVDGAVLATLAVLSVVLSGQNRELDSADIENLLDYCDVSGYAPALARLEIFSGNIVLGKNQTVVSLLTLSDDSTSTKPNVPVEYQAVGFLGKEAKESVDVQLPLHLAVINGFFHETIAKLEKSIAEVTSVRAAAVQKSIVSGRVDSTDEGIVL